MTEGVKREEERGKEEGGDGWIYIEFLAIDVCRPARSSISPVGSLIVRSAGLSLVLEELVL